MSTPAKLKESPEGVTDDPKTDAAANKPAKSWVFWDQLPPWVSTNVRSPQSWKILLRCWLASWAAFVLLLPDKSLKAMGNAAFFALLASFIIPPSIPVQVFLFAIMSMIVGMCLGWGIGAAGMKAALSVRNQVVLEQTLLTAERSAAGAVNPDAQFQLIVFQGVFLDTRSSAMFGAFLAFATFIFALIRAYAPKFALLSVFGTVVADIFCSYGPLFPAAEYTIVSSLVISVACYVAIAVVVITVVFPETMNHSFLTSASALIGSVKGYIQLQEGVLSNTPEDLVADKNGIMTKAMTARSGMFAAQQGLLGKAGLINAEFSWGKWSGDDCKSLLDPLGIVITRAAGLQSFSKLVSLTAQSDISRTTTNSDNLSNSHVSLTGKLPGDTELIRQLYAKTSSYELAHNVRMVDIIPIVHESTLELRAACIEGLTAMQAVIDEINTRRWSRNSPGLAEKENELDAAVANLRVKTDEYKTSKRLALVSPFLPVLKSLDATTHHLPLRSLILSCSFAANLVVTADSVVSLSEQIRETTHKRRKNRLWAPNGLRAIWKFLLRKDQSSEALGEDSRPDVDEVEKEEEEVYQHDPDSRRPTSFMQIFADSLYRLYMWFKTPEAQFCVKYVILTIALWLPSVFPHSAYFVYVNKGVWALIMAQTTLNIYVADQLYNYVARLFGTFMGLLMGLLTWYIGNGKGHGNPFGTAASLGVFLIPILFIRVFAPPHLAIPTVMFSVSFALIVGYSWIDGHLAVIGSPGIGWNVAWKRWVLVVIGCVASFILLIFTPISGRKAVRLRNAAIITEISSLYAYLLSTWITDDDEIVSEKNRTLPKWTGKFRERLISLASQVQSLRIQTASAKWEGNIRGVWPLDEYNSLVNTETEMLASLAQLASALGHLDPTWRLSLNTRTKVLNPNFITDVMSVFALVSQSLRTGEAMHQVLPSALVDRLYYHHKHANVRETDDVAARSETVSIIERIQSVDYMYYAVGIASVSQIVTGLDELHAITKRLCGEIPFKGFDEWRSEYERVYASN